MRPDALAVGVLIDYRGYAAEVTDCWVSVETAQGGFNAPVGAVIEWRDETGESHQCRLLWSDPADGHAEGLNGDLVLWEG